MSRVAPFALVFVAACLSSTGGPPTEGATASSSGAIEGSSSSGVVEGSSSSGAGETSATEAGGSSGGVMTTTAVPEPALPKIVFVELKPDPIEEAGMVSVEARTSDAEAVRMRVDAGPPVELAQVEPDRYVGEIPIISYLANGTHSVELTPARGGTEGPPLERTFDASLYDGGTQIGWMEMSDVGGQALATAVAAGPDESTYFIGTLEPAGTHRCWLRRFSPTGSWMNGDLLVPMLPEAGCDGVDVAVGSDGRLYVLAQREVNGTSRWWLGSKATWQSPFEDVLWGPAGSRARALAQGPGGRLAVCGERPTGFGDSDAFVTVYEPLKLGSTHEFDWQPGPGTHEFDEVARDCAFVGEAGEKVVLVGEVVGLHPDDWLEERRRELVLELDTATKAAAWRVASTGPGALTQSAARGVAADGSGGYVTAGHVCEDICVPQLRLQRFAGGEPVDEWMPEVATPGAAGIAWHPAGYAVVTAAEIEKAWSSKIWAAAWIPGEQAPLWQFSDEIWIVATRMPLGITVSPFGAIYLAGVSPIVGDKDDLNYALKVQLAP